MAMAKEEHQLIQNLLENSIFYIKRGEPQIALVLLKEISSRTKKQKIYKTKKNNKKGA